MEHHCQFCNEGITSEDLYHAEDIIEIGEKLWHAECYAEYFGLSLDEALEEAQLAKA